MKGEIIFGVILVLALLGFFVYQFGHLGKTQTTFYSSEATSSRGLFGLFPKSPFGGTSNSGSSATSTGLFGNSKNPYAPYQSYQGASGKTGNPYAPYETYKAPTSSPAALSSLGFSDANISPYYGKIRIGNFGRGQNNVLQFTLFGTPPGNEKINITGWEVRANHGGVFVPQVVNDYSPSGVGANSDLVFAAGDQATFYGSASPVGENIRLNKCIGYTDTQQKFNPRLPGDCPSALLPLVQNFSAECQDYVASLASCQVPDLNKVKLPYYDDACREYLSTLNYAGCHARYVSFPGFFKQEWLIWTGTDFANPRHDWILLLDKQGKVVDGYVY